MHRLQGRDQVAGALATGWSHFEAPLPAWLFAAAQHWPGTVVDAGSNTGFYALLAAAASRRNRVFAFEPEPVIAAALVRNIAANGFRRRIEVRRAARSNVSGAGTLFFPIKSHGLVETSASLDPDFNHGPTIAQPVRVETLDSAIGQQASRPVCLIKIDVEGHEAEVLAGAAQVVARDRPVVFLEVLHATPIGPLEAFLGRHDYWSLRLGGATRSEWSRAIETDPWLWNHAFVPAEKIEAFEALAPATNL